MRDELRAKLEPIVDPLITDGMRIQASVAISLKRIADALEKQGQKSVFEQVFGK